MSDTDKRSQRSRALDPELKALRAIDRALVGLDKSASVRVLEFACARALGLPGFDLELGRKNARLAESLRWLRHEIANGGYRDTPERQRITALIDRSLSEAVAP